MGRVDDTIAKLAKEEAATSCPELVLALEGLAFKVRKCSKGNHYTFVHPHLEGFFGSDFNGGHEKHVKKVYVQRVRKLIERYRAELVEQLEVKR
jgi:hypothetical protein